MKTKKTSKTSKATRRASKPAKPLAKKAPRRNKLVRAKSDVWNLRLYVAGQTPKSLTAFANLKRLCEQHLPGRHEIEVVDLTRQPHLAVVDQVVALPTLIRKLPEPIKRLIGDLSNTERVMIGMEFAALMKNSAAK